MTSRKLETGEGAWNHDMKVIRTCTVYILCLLYRQGFHDTYVATLARHTGGIHEKDDANFLNVT